MEYHKAQIKHALEHQEELIQMFAKEPRKKLEKRITIINLQFVEAEKEKVEDVGEFLRVMERIIIEAMFYKEDNNIPDELSEIEQELAENEAAMKKEKQEEKRLAKLAKSKIKESEPIEEMNQEIKPDTKVGNSVQLGLF